MLFLFQLFYSVVACCPIHYSDLTGLSPLVFSLRGINAFSRETTLSSDFSPTENGSTLKGKNLLPLGANSFLLE